MSIVALLQWIRMTKKIFNALMALCLLTVNSQKYTIFVTLLAPLNYNDSTVISHYLRIILCVALKR